MTTSAVSHRGDHAHQHEVAGPAGVDRLVRAGSLPVTLEAVTEFVETGAIAAWVELTGRDRATFTTLGWLDDTGTITVLGTQVRDDLAHPAHTLHLRSHDETRRVGGFVRVGARSALVVGEAAYTARSDDEDGAPYRGDVAVDLVPVAALPLVLARWGGVRPTGHVVGETFRLGDGAALGRRLRDAATVLPDDADADLADVWAQPWTWWSVRSDEGDVELTYVDAGSAGQFAVRENGAALVRRPESLVWGELQRVSARLAALRDEADPDGSDW